MSKHNYHVAILTSSDKCSAGEREDGSGACIKEMIEEAGYTIADYIILPDEFEQLSKQMLTWSESNTIDLILTTGGTGFSERDCMPEATLSIADRIAPGIAEAIRAYSMQITKRAMLSRAVSAICRKTLIINLPGSPKAVKESLEFILSELEHGLDILTGRGRECASDDIRKKV